MRKRKKNQSSAAITWRSLMTLIIGLMVGMTVIILVAVSEQLLSEAQTNSTRIIESLKEVTIDDDDDWETWRHNSTLDTDSSYVHVRNARKDAKIKYYNSPDADDLLEITPVAMPFNDHLYYRPHFGFIYRRTGHARGIYYTLWLSMNSSIKLLMQVLKVTLVLLVLVLIISPFFVRWLTRRLTGSLATLSATTEQIATAANPSTMQLPVPAKPTEVADLATNFNNLLAMLNAREEQQKLFVMNAAHELRTPIATIKSHAQLIERRAAEHPEIVPKSVHYITEESRQMQQLIEELMQLSRADRMRLDLAAVNLSQLVPEFVGKVQNNFDRPIRLDVAADVWALTNVTAVQEILTNLITNAVKYSPADTPVTISLEQSAQTVQLTVADHGRGIPDAEKEQIFERFYRSADVRGSIPGTGLGLPIAAQLAELSQGKLTVADNPPTGSVFTLALQATDADSAEA
ncbi:sensor histidine kinase [Lacticaseibacillus sharpeae]|nr:HAMP domain-containing sensor histidine kinase [Lacticaseibacillus sharpeae]